MKSPTAKAIGRMPIAYHIGGDGAPLQSPFDAAIVIPTLLRPSLARALRSIFAQENIGRLHILIGVDRAEGDIAAINPVFQEQPDNCVTTLVNLGYSTSTRHGGVHAAWDGGALRTILSYMANSRYVAYLDDDNWLAPDHVEKLLKAIQGHDYAYTLRWYVDPATLKPLCVDRLESVGPDAGGYKDSLRGFVDPNCLMLDKIACLAVLGLWSVPMKGDDTNLSADRQVFAALVQHFRGGPTHTPTVFYRLNELDKGYSKRLEWIARQSNKNAGTQ
ncbi:glycosyltransferase [Hwanghaeella sp. 1Z406]|jgi:hypothetical protein|uniref:glycosyltransferase n=1 Tax=Hwanghaeella sp. 1Z406 TaxID=3402811 RepID=UPI003B682E3E|tara:strand:+ start:136116 stop:136940 length:825 start_codon:yes stop_codon:yes gene_type:complete